MNLKLIGMLASLGVGGAALAQSSAGQTPQQPYGQQQKQQQPSQPGMGGAGQQAQPNTVTGKVLGVHAKTVYLEGPQGEAIPLTVTKQTQVSGKEFKNESELRKELQPGQEVTASFQLKRERSGEASNIATSIEPSAMGGAGKEGTQKEHEMGTKSPTGQPGTSQSNPQQR